MKYAELIALAVVLIAVGPALMRNMRGKGKQGGDGDPSVPNHPADAAGDPGSDSGAD